MSDQNSEISVASRALWCPNKYLAALLGFFTQPLAMLYVGRPGWALLYLLLPVLILTAEIALHAPWFPAFTLAVVVAMFCALHAYRAAAHGKGLAVRPLYRRWYGLLAIYLTYLGVVLAFRAFFYEPFRMPSSSMYPGLPAGSYVVVKKLGYGNYGTYGVGMMHGLRSAPLSRGDVVVFDSPENGSVHYIKRIIGLPGDVVVLKERELFINGVALGREMLGADSCIKESEQRCTLFEEQLGIARYRVAYLEGLPPKEFGAVVPAQSYFVMGDNRDNSRDSRYLGAIPERNIVGRVVLSVAAEGAH